jgi:DNA polymerase V
MRPDTNKKTTKVMRVPLWFTTQLESYIKNKGYRLPLLSGKVPAGFPLNTESHVEEWIDLNEMIVRDPDSMFMIEAVGDSMIGAGIQEKDLLIVSSKTEPTHGKIVIAAINGDYTVKRLHRKADGTRLIPANDAYPSIEISDNVDFHIAGVVVKILRNM